MSVHEQQLQEHRIQQQREAQEEARQRAEATEPAAPAPVAEAPRPAVPKVDAREVLASAGLQMVETDASKSRPMESEPEPVKLGRPRRERAAQPRQEEALVQVETRDT
ncbi:MAG: hypothetical protein IT513_08365 [Burkholderiales bacterium]|nr:hypothetical protein [Burkholderiales bacterium]